MQRLDRRQAALAVLVAITLSLSAALAGPFTTSAEAGVPLLSPCDLPVVGRACDVVAGAAGAVAGTAGDFVMRGVTVWVTNAAVWVTGKVGSLVDATTSPDLQAGWFENQYGTMLTAAGALALLLLTLAVIQAVIRQDIWLLLRSAFAYLPMAFILAGVAIVGTQLLIAITDDLSGSVVAGLGSQSDSLLSQVGDAYKHALADDSVDAVPLFGIFLSAIILAIGGFVLWLELIVRDAAIYVCVFFLPLTFVGMIWPATGRWARRLVELLVAIVLSKFVIMSILTLATAAIANMGIAESDGHDFERMLAGAALLVLAAWSPFGLLRLIPMMEVAAASVGGQRAAIGNATASTGIQSPAGYMRQAMNSQSRAQSSHGYSTATIGTRAATGHGGGFSGSSGGGQTGANRLTNAARADVRPSQPANEAGATGVHTAVETLPVSKKPNPSPSNRRQTEPTENPQPPRQGGLA